MQLFRNKKFKLSNCSQRFFATLSADLELAISSRKKYEEIMKKIIDEIGDIDIRDIDLFAVTKMKQALNERNLSASRRNHYITVLRLLLKYIRDTEGVKVLDFALIKKYKEEKKPVEFLTDEEVQILLNSISETSLTRIRLKTLIICLLSTGARISEIMNLNRDDIDLEKGLAMTKGKGGKINQIIFNHASLEYLKRYFSMRKDEDPSLFATGLTNKPRRWQINCAERAVRNQGRRAGMNKRIYCHRFRKAAASKMFFAGTPLPVVARFLGHSDISTTQRYYLRAGNFEEVLDAHKKCMEIDLGVTK